MNAGIGLEIRPRMGLKRKISRIINTWKNTQVQIVYMRVSLILVLPWNPRIQIQVKESNKEDTEKEAISKRAGR